MKKMKRMQRCAGLVATGAAFGVLNGCSPHDHGVEGGEARTAQITVFGERHEIFAEHRLVVAGTATRFVTHVTDLKTLEPRREGPVRFQMRLGQEAPLEQAEPAPSRAGIYEAMLTFPKAGEWSVALVVPTDDGEQTIPFTPVKVFANAHDAEHAELPEPPDGISFLKEQQWKVLSKTEPSAKRRIVERVRVAARVRAKPGFSATLVAPVSGQLAAPADQMLPQPGQRVAAGQLLALLKPNFSEAAAKVAEADAEFTTARAALDQAEAAFARTRKLAAEQAKSPRELQEAELAHASAKARYAAAAGLLATFKRSGGVVSPDAPLLMELRAPIAGVLNSMAAGPGETVSADQPVFSVLNPESVWIEANIPETSVGRLSAARDALVELPGPAGRFISVTGEGRGQLISLGLEVDSAMRTVPLIYEMKNPDGTLRVGQSLNLHVETARAEETLAIPDAAMVEEDGRPIAFVQVAGETFEKRDLAIGIRDGNWVQVLSGITEGERVVTKGAYAVRLASVSSAIPAHGHVH
jgi:cobalt-zinc-cadmium efflux system membrane fusion protein